MIVCCFFKQKTAYEMRISDWSSDVCSSDLLDELHLALGEDVRLPRRRSGRPRARRRIGATAYRPGDDRGRAADDARRRRAAGAAGRSEERRVGKEGGNECRYRWSP